MRGFRLGGIIAIVVVGLLGLSVPGARGQADLVAAAKKEGKVVVYGSMESNIFDVVDKIFEGKYGIKSEYFRAAANRLMDRVLTEARAGKPLYDVVLTNRSPMLILKREGVFGKYVSPSYDLFPTNTIDRDQILSPSYRMVVVGVLYNTKLVKASDAPKTLMDLLDPKWKGKIAFPDPTVHTTTTIWLANLERTMPPQQWKTFIERLPGQVTLVESFLPSLQRVISGESPIAVTYIKYVYSFGKEGAPIDYVRMNPVLAEAHHIAINAKAPHPNAAKLFVDVFTSKLGLLTLAQAGEFVLVPGVYPPIKDSDKLHIVMMEELDDAALKKFRDQYGPLFVKR